MEKKKTIKNIIERKKREIKMDTKKKNEKKDEQHMNCFDSKQTNKKKH